MLGPILLEAEVDSSSEANTTTQMFIQVTLQKLAKSWRVISIIQSGVDDRQ